MAFTNVWAQSNKEINSLKSQRAKLQKKITQNEGMLKSLKKLYCGNIFHNTWEEIWDAPAMELLRKIPDCRDCTYNCGVWCRALKFFMDGNLYGKSRYCLKELNV